MASSRKILGVGGGFGTGLVLLVAGLVVKHSQEKMVSECSTGLGQFGQVLDPNVAKNCSTAQALSSMATGAIWIGAIILAIAVGGFVAFLIASGALAAGKKPKIVVPATGGAGPAGAGPAAPARPNPAGGAVLRPIVPVVVGQEDSPPAYPAGSGCGHELNGNRFCTVCGRPAADDGWRDVFAAEPTVSASGAEITTVLPVFAPAEPADLTASARVPDMPSGWSLASVTSGPPTGLADRPAVPGPRAGLADRPPVPAPVPADRPAVPGPLAGLADRPPVPTPVSADRPPVPATAWASRPPVPGPSAGLADRPPVAAPVRADRPPVPAPVAADRPPPPRGAVGASPPWGWADPPPAPGSTVGSAPPWGQAESASAAPDGKVSSGPPWESAEPLPAPSGAKPDPDGDGTGSRQSGRHRSRRP